MIGAISTLVGKDLKERLRDKSFFLLGILTPLMLAFIMDLVFGDLGEGELEVRLGVVDADSSEIAGHLREGLAALDGEGGVEVDVLDPGTDPDDAVLDDDLDAVMVIPDGFGSGVASPTGDAPGLEIVENPERPVQAGVAESILDGFVADLERTRLINAAGAELGLSERVELSDSGVAPERETPGGEGLDMGARMMAGMAVMFVFFTVQFGVTTLLNEKENGTLTRLLAAPIPRDSIVAAKGVVSYVLGVLATMILMVAATLLIGASWGSWLGVTLLVLGAVLTAVALMAVVAGVAKTAEGAGAAQAIIAVGLAMLGGSWFEVSGEGLVGSLARLTPHYWFLGGLEDLADADSWTVVGTPVAVMALISVVAGVPAAVLLRRRLTP
ncbi:ABC transporter permease [Phytoactinopolyspora halotolerans]|uniref:ABC transporter permease n=1 Tax=Phytoactinopolyspora halotolerans TaxID=1981512 RepID=A0A6L9SD09_9ACTN|nr:ABC transporter permease [Phytoactinopolyspora halotolerans]NEE02534.1 ABC transporter permease [Phytoactinopolyspora halotolerans]